LSSASRYALPKSDFDKAVESKFALLVTGCCVGSIE
jgi:hypothetical protein